MVLKITYNYVKRDIQLGEYVLWLFIWGFLLFISIIPQITTNIAPSLGLTRGTDLIVILSIIALFFMNYGLYKRVDEQEKNLTKLVRELSKKK